MQSVAKKEKRLKDILASMRSVLVAYSGGADSTLLLKAAKDMLGKNVLAVTADSATLPSRELKDARAIAKKLGVKHILVRTRELSNSKFFNNDAARCYWCKKELYSKLRDVARQHNISHIVDGSNAEDKSDYRPGARAVRECGVRKPLEEAGLFKEEIRKLSKKLRLPSWNKPSSACLASRVPYGVKIKGNTLARIEKAENVLKDLGFAGARVRHHGDIARIEVGKKQIPKLFKGKAKNKIIGSLKKLGYSYITIDLEGYTRGSLNKLLRK